MASRNDLVYDEDDYVPPGYVPKKPGNKGSKPLFAVIIVGLAIGAIAVMFLMRSRERTRFARFEQARAKQVAIASTRLAGSLAPGEEVGNRLYSDNWKRIVGSWSLVEGPNRKTKLYPIHFVFSEGPSRIVLNDNSTLEVRFPVRHEGPEMIVVEAQPRSLVEGADETYSKRLYHFSFGPDDSITLNDATMGRLVYSKDEPNPARLGMPRR
jgi:hypothetical protein